MDERIALGTYIGPYKILRCIGKGGMGEVYEAHEAHLNRNVALKVVTDEAIKNVPDALNLFLREGKALAQLNHPNVVTIYQLGFDKGTYYIAMELAKGESLDVYLKENKPGFEESVLIFEKILAGVRALHKKRIIHRDLKPKNIIVQPNRGVKIVDFGIAQIVADTSPALENQPVIGSVYYMAPELADGKMATVQSDIWSLGVILFQLLTRTRPFSGSSPTVVLKKAREQEMRFTPIDGIRIPEKYQKIALKMCAKSLDERYKNIDEILHDLQDESEPEEEVVPKVASGGLKWPISIGVAIGAIGFMALKLFPFAEPPAEPVTEQPIAANSEAPIVTPSATPELQLNDEPTISAPGTPSKPIAVEPAATATPSVSLPVSPRVVSQPNLEVATPLPAARYSTPPPQFNPSTAVRQRTVVVRKPAKTKPERVTASIEKVPAPSWQKGNYKFSVKASGKSDSKLAIEWKPVPSVSQYKVTIAKDRSFGRPVANEVVTGSSYTLNSLQPGSYYARVVSLDRDRKPASESSTVASIQIQLQAQPGSQLAKPNLLQPMNGIVVPSAGTMITPIACSWSSTKSAATYEFQLASDANFKSIQHQTAVSATQYVVMVPLSNGKFFWRVRAVGKDQDASAWSQPRNFIID